jgi:SRSO17 transposase
MVPIRKRRIELILKIIKGEEIRVIIDETGDRKKGNKTDSNFVSVFNQEKLAYILAIRSNQGVWLMPGQKVRGNRWREFARVFASGERETRYVREIIFGQKREIRYWEITDDKENLPKNSTWYVMTRVPDITYKDVGNL